MIGRLQVLVEPFLDDAKPRSCMAYCPRSLLDPTGTAARDPDRTHDRSRLGQPSSSWWSPVGQWRWLCQLAPATGRRTPPTFDRSPCKFDLASRRARGALPDQTCPSARECAWPLYQPFSIGLFGQQRWPECPRFAAAIIPRGHRFLSQPMVSTTPSAEYPNRTSTRRVAQGSVERGRWGRLPVSWILWIGNSSAMPRLRIPRARAWRAPLGGGAGRSDGLARCDDGLCRLELLLL